MKKIKLQLFGSFSLQSDTGVLSEELLSSNQLLRLLAYLLIYRDKVLTHQDLIEKFSIQAQECHEGTGRRQIHMYAL